MVYEYEYNYRVNERTAGRAVDAEVEARVVHDGRERVETAPRVAIGGGELVELHVSGSATHAQVARGEQRVLVQVDEQTAREPQVEREPRERVLARVLAVAVGGREQRHVDGDQLGHVGTRV